MISAPTLDEKRKVNLTAQQRWVLGWIVLTLGLAALPFVWGWIIAPPGQQFSGFLLNALDGNTYLSKMEEGRQGSWKFYLIYTGEQGGSGAYTYLFYLVLGKLAGLLSLPNIIIFHLARLAGGLALLLASYRFIRLLLSEPARQRFAFRLVCLSAGLGWLLLSVLPNPPDFWVSEAYTFQSILVNPHFPVATALLIYIITEGMLGLEEGRNLRFYWKAWLASFALGFVHPFLLFTLAGVLGLVWLRRVIFVKKPDWVGFAALVLTGVAGSPGPFLTWWGTTHDPLLSRWMAQNQTPSLNIPNSLAAFGLLIPFVLVGCWWVERVLSRQSEVERTAETAEKKVEIWRWQVVTTWLLVTVVLLALPFNFSRRFLEGIHLPLCCLATAGYYAIFPKAGDRLKEKVFTLVCSVSTLTLVILSVALLYLPSNDLYDPIRSPFLSQGELAAINWLDQNTKPGEVILTGPVLGNVLPGRVLRPVFYGQYFETLDSQRKLGQVIQFFDPKIPMTFREGLIKDERLSYLVYGWREQQLGAFDPASAGWPLLFNQDDVRIYRLT